MFGCLDPPGQIDNHKISTVINGQVTLRITADYGQISEDTWHFLHGIYSGRNTHSSLQFGEFLSHFSQCRFTVLTFQLVIHMGAW